MVSSLIEYGADCLGGGAELERQRLDTSMHNFVEGNEGSNPFTALTCKTEFA